MFHTHLFLDVLAALPILLQPKLVLPPLDDFPHVPDFDEAAKVSGHEPRQSGGGLQAAHEVRVAPEGEREVCSALKKDPSHQSLLRLTSKWRCTPRPRSTRA